MHNMTAIIPPESWNNQVSETDIDPIVSELTDSVDDLGRLLSSTANVAWEPPQNRFPVENLSEIEDSTKETKEEEGLVFYSSAASTSSSDSSQDNLIPSSSEEFWPIENEHLNVLRDKKSSNIANKELKRWSTISMTSQRPSDATNCDCTSIAFASFRNSKAKSKKLKALKEQEECYKKTTPPDSPDSGVDSSSSCSEDKPKRKKSSTIIPLPKSPSKNKKEINKSSTITIFLNSFMYKMFRFQKTTKMDNNQKAIENNQAFIPRWRNDSINEAKPLQEQLISNNLPVTTTSTSTINLNLNQNQKSNINKSINVSKIIPTSKQSIFNDSINLTIEPKNLPPLITPFKTRIFNKLANSEGFYFPTGKPVSKIENDTVLQNVQKYFNGRQLLCQDFIEIAQLIGFPLYSKKPIFEACCQINSKIITDNTAIIFDEFRKYWERMTMHNHDEASRFVFTLTIAKSGLPERNYLKREDFHSMFYDLIQTYPGLQFLIEATQFHSRYVEVVTARIFWNVNKSWSNKITINELKESNLLQTMHLLEETDEINKITEYFSYEHFYVIYCKFWELDEDHDMIISKNDMKMHCNGALTNRIIDRIFSTAVTRIPRKNDSYPPKSGDLEFIGFEDFVAFLLAEEDKKHPKAIEYWFRCIDLDGDGIISFYEMELFYKEIAAKIQQKGYETLDFKDVASQLYDLVSPENEQIRLKDLKKCGLAHRFFNTFVNYLKYLEQESADGERASVKINGDKEMSDWDQFCAIEYEMLMSEADQNDDGNDEAYDLIVDDEDEMISGITNDIGVNGF